jgi:hypothetical protein
LIEFGEESKMNIDLNRLKEIEAISLAKGAHEDLREGVCVMEAVSYIAGEPWSDYPKCVCPVIASFCRAWNDALPQDKRDELLKPLISRLINTLSSKNIEVRRSMMAADWLVRVHTPAWLRLSGLTSHADALALLPEITSMAQAPFMRAPVEAARKDASAASDAAKDAAWAAAKDAAWDAAWAAACEAASDAASNAAKAAAWDAAWADACDAAKVAAKDAAWAAAKDAAWDAASDAAWDAASDAASDAAKDAAWDAAWADACDAASDAAWAALSPTVESLQASAINLLNRMIEVK